MTVVGCLDDVVYSDWCHGSGLHACGVGVAAWRGQNCFVVDSVLLLVESELLHAVVAGLHSRSCCLRSWSQDVIKSKLDSRGG